MAEPAVGGAARSRGRPARLVVRTGQPAWEGNLLTRVVTVGDVAVGGPDPVVIAGPCAVESRAQTLELAHAVKAAGATMLRGGAFKPRTSPYDFQGLGRAGLEILAEARAATGLPVVTEVLDPRDVAMVAELADVFQIGARNMQNYPLLREVGRAGKPVLLKRHWAATLLEWLCAAEYVAVEGNLDVILCERGIRTFTHTDYNRNTLDLNVVPAVREMSFLPVVVDPSHATGVASLVPPVCFASVAAGAHGLLVEVLGERTRPEDALSDGHQSIRPSVLADVIARLRTFTPGAVAGTLA
ncbi:MAG: 3-deoxy-7-phosphoheptulonate synthase [Planctomycetia bacterium]|nr:3-deoxy-7-phosphoheptulonate synthase [Planctomycetia bacterium]